MQIPKTIKIGGYTYEVIEDNANLNGRGGSGQHDAMDQKIWIDSTQHQEQKESTLLHEIIEAINSLNNLELNHQQICALETNLYQVLKDNLCSTK